MYLYEAAEACDCILQFTKGKSRGNYLSDDPLQSAVERQMTVLGEALRQTVLCDLSLRQSVTDCDGISEMAAQLVELYDSVDAEAVFTAVESSVPPLRADLAGLLGDDDPAAGPAAEH